MTILNRLGRHIRAQTRKNFLTGLLVIVPLGLTYYVVASIVNGMDRVLAILPPRFHPETYLPFRIPGLGVIVTLLIIQTVGFLSANLFGRSVVKAYERVLERIPLVRWVYQAIKQLLEQILSNRGDRFRRVVLVEYPRRGIYSLGFVTGEARGEVQEKTEEVTLNVFVPTTPNPTSGFYLLVPRSQVVPLEMTVERAFRLIMSAGMLGSEGEDKKARPLGGRAAVQPEPPTGV